MRDISVMNIHRNYLFKNSPVLTSFLPVSGQCFHGFLLYAFQMLDGCAYYQLAIHSLILRKVPTNMVQTSVELQIEYVYK